MSQNSIKGKIHSFQSLGTVDGPGVRFVVFMQGCNLRCACCHNPDTHSFDGGMLYTPEEILKKVTRYREYFGNDGGITLSGGEPILQAKFAHRLFSLCHSEGINTCLDTSGGILNDDVKALISETDRVLLDIKFTTDDDYRRYVGCSIEPVLKFLSYLNEKNVKTTLRQVIIPTLNDSEESILRLKKIIRENPSIDKTELLPFKKICQTKYDNLKIPFPLAHLPEPKKSEIQRLEKLLNKEKTPIF